MSRFFVYLTSSFSPSPIPVSPSESVTKSPPLCYYTPSPLLLKSLPFFYKNSSPRFTKNLPYVTKSHACLPVTLSPSYPVIPLSPVTHRTCSSVTLSFITINLSTCLLANLSTYSLTLSPSYPVIPFSPVTHRTCSSVTLSFITINLSTCLLVNLSTYSLTLSPLYPVIPLSPVTHRTCTSVTLSFIAPTCVPLSPRRPVLRPTVYYMFTLCHSVILSKHVIMSLCL